MANSGQGNEEPPPSGLLGRLWGGGGGRKKPQKANLGDKNTLFYDNELKCWRRPGDAPPEGVGGLPPPPTRSSAAVPQNPAQFGAPANRYVVPNSNPSSSPAPTFGQSPAKPAQPGFGPVQPAAGGGRKPNFFVPSGPKPSDSAGSTSDRQTSPGLAQGPFASHSSQNSQGTPRTPDSSRSNVSQGKGGWAEWRQRDQENREKERRMAEEVGTQVLESMHQDPGDLERSFDPAQMNITSSFNDLEDQPAFDTGEESVGDNTGFGQSGESSLTFKGWQPTSPQDGSVSSPMNPGLVQAATLSSPRESSQIPTSSPQAVPAGHLPGAEWPQGKGPQADAANEFFGGEAGAGFDPEGGQMAADALASGSDFFNDNILATHADHLLSSIGIPEESSQSEGLIDTQTTYDLPLVYDSYTIEQWEEYYKAEGHAEEDVQRWLQDWINRGPDPPANIPAAEPSVPQDDPHMDAPGLAGDPLEAQSPVTGAIGGSEMPPNATLPETTPGSTIPELAPQQVANGALQPQHDVFGFQAGSNALAEDQYIGLGERTQFQHDAYGDFVKQQSEQPGMLPTAERIRDLAHLKQLLNEQKQLTKDPGFGKLTGALPWDGILLDQDGTPVTSPKAFMAPNSKRRKSKLGRIKQEADLNDRAQSAPADALALHLAQMPKNELGATWLDKFGEKILTIQFYKAERKRLEEEAALQAASAVKAEPHENGAPGPILPSISAPGQAQSPRGPLSPAGVGSPGRQNGTPIARNEPHTASVSPKSAKKAEIQPQPPSNADAFDPHLAHSHSPRAPAGSELAAPPRSPSEPATPVSGSQNIADLATDEPASLDAQPPTDGWESMDEGMPSITADTSLVGDGLLDTEDDSSGQGPPQKDSVSQDQSSALNSAAVLPNALSQRVAELENQLQESHKKLQQQAQDTDILLERIAAFEEEQKLLQTHVEGEQKYAEDSQRLKADLYDLTMRNQSLATEVADLRERLVETEALRTRVAELEAQLASIQPTLDSQTNAQPSQEALDAVAKDLDIARQQAQALTEQVEKLEDASNQAQRTQEQLSNELQQAVDQLDFATRRKEELEVAVQKTLELESQVTQLQSEARASTDEVMHLKAQIESGTGSSSEEVVTLKSQIAELETATRELEDLRAQRLRDSSEHALLIKELEELTQAKMDLEEENDAIQSTVAALHQAQEGLAARNSEFESLQAEVQDLRSQVASAQSNLPTADSSSVHLKKIEELESKNAEWQVKIRKAKKAYDKVSGEKTEAQEKMKTLEAEITRLQSSQASQEEGTSQSGALIAQCEDLQQQVSALEAECSQLQHQIQGYEAQMASLQANYEAGQAEIQLLEESSAEFESQLVALNQKNEGLESLLTESKSVSEQLNADLREAQERLSQVESDLEAQSSDLADSKMLAETAIQERDEALKAADSAHREASFRIQGLEARLAEAEAPGDSEAQQTALDQLQEQCQELTSRAAQLEAHISQLEAQLSEARESESAAQESAQKQAELVEGAEERITDLTEEVETLKDALESLRQQDRGSAVGDASEFQGAKEEWAAEKAALEDDLEELMAMAGQEDAKIQRLSELLAEHGVDVSTVLAQVELEYLQELPDSTEAQESHTEPESQPPDLTDAESVTSALPEALEPPKQVLGGEQPLQAETPLESSQEFLAQHTESNSPAFAPQRTSQAIPSHPDRTPGVQGPGVDASDIDFFNDVSDNNGWGADDDFFANGTEATQPGEIAVSSTQNAAESVEYPAALPVSGGAALSPRTAQAGQDERLQEHDVWGGSAKQPQGKAQLQGYVASDWPEEDDSERFFSEDLESTTINNSQQPSLHNEEPHVYASQKHIHETRQSRPNTEFAQPIVKSLSAEELDWLDQPIGDGDWA